MHDSLIYAVISTIAEKTNLKHAQVSEKTYQEFEKLDLSMELRRLFQWHWFSEDADCGPIIYSAEKILKIEKERRHLKAGIIQIGTCVNGDDVFLRTKDSAILYWSHDELETWQGEPENCPKTEEFLFLAYSRVEYLLLNICNSAFIPWDSYSAQEYFDLYHGK